MSCSEVMYQYYPYLYQRPPPPPNHPHAAPHPHSHGNPHAAHHSPARPAPFQPFSATAATHQYDRLNVHQRSLEAAGLELCGVGGSLPQGQPSSTGSIGSAPSPASPRPTPQPRQPLATTTSQSSRTLDDDRSTDAVGGGTAAEDSDDGESRAQYVSANCVVFTHYRGDAATEVDEHFHRALQQDNKLKENISPMNMRNFPPSFWKSHHPGDVYEYPTDPWHPHYPQYHHRAVHEYHHHNMAAAASYGGLLLGGARGLGHHTTHHAAHHAHAAASYKDWTSATPSQSLVDASSAPPYPHGPYAPLSGLESQVQDSKDMYWF
ncbi:protein vestigial isoform X1 [Belonocnema kinseyi]|uniref:protein vestigial isoform X1 n=1 Tax=Belonocnema kinseyi TaxID=2817044 RepID=UPI00143DA6D5|nr:protein vestigial isoform X1 [Belonocnema kinseyi]